MLFRSSNDERSKHELSLLKLSSLCAKNEYDKAFNFIDSIEFDDYEYSCYKQVILNRIHVMERQSVEDIPERNFYFREAVDFAFIILKHSGQNAVSLFSFVNASARFSPASLSFFSRKNVRREAVRGPIPGSRENASISA